MIYPDALEAGIDPVKFWDMTLAEHKAVINSYRRKQIINNYQSACLVTNFIGKGMNGEKIPDIYDMFPQIFTKKQMEAYEQSVLDEYSKQFTAFANMKNKKMEGR